ncbi:hypothetical protein IAD21_01083 [Abditibacteriota bacterium]|nr:hypothetical protein IAD21_01083 [Abditibacteriota bacterium]
MRNHFSLVVVALGAALLPSFASAQGKLPFLKAEGTRIVTSAGHPVVLRGFNLGNWLVEEMWLSPFDTDPPAGSEFKKINDHVRLHQTFVARFGQEKADRLLDSWRANFLTSEDFARLKAEGVNCVRLPFTYDLESEPGGLFRWLDFAVAQARVNGIYVILDLHGAPGRQGIEHHTGEEGVNQFFADAKFRAQTVQLWGKIAAHYKDEPAVAGYDLLNEPVSAPNASSLHFVHSTLYEAVRAVDPNHIVIIEDGYKNLDQMPDPRIMGWKNVMYSMHSYKFDAKTADDYDGHLKWWVMAQSKGVQDKWQVPVYVGEWNLEPHGNPEKARMYAQTFDAANISWSLWTYKTTSKWGGSMWGLYTPKTGLKAINPFTDSFEQIEAAMPEIRTENLVRNPDLAAALAPSTATTPQ